VTSPDWTPIGLTLNGVPFDPRTGTLCSYRRELNLREGTLTRRLVWEDSEGRQTEIESVRFAAIVEAHLVGVGGMDAEAYRQSSLARFDDLAKAGALTEREAALRKKLWSH